MKPLTPPTIRLITSNTTNMKKRIFAMDAAPAAMPPKPNTAAIKATTRNVIIHRNIIISFSE